MRRLSFRLTTALLTFVIGIVAVSLWLALRQSTSSTIKPKQDVSISTLNQEQPTKRNQETPAERFYRKGGKTTRVAVSEGKYSELTTADISQGRALALYDQGGHFDCRVSYERDLRRAERNEARARDFLWQHWQEKRLGCISITYNSVDAVSTSYIFIETDEQGTWHIVWRIVRHNDEIDDMPDISSVERRLATKEDRPKIGTPLLIFKDKEGDEVQTLPDNW